MKNIKYIFLSAVLIGFTACNDDDYDYNPAPEPLPALTAGTADFTNFVSVGASFTAGFTDNGLFMASQENSFPNIMANQFANIGGGTFTQPMMSDNYGGLAAGGTRIQDPRLVFGGAGPVPLESLIGPVTVGTDIVLNNPTGPFNNLGIPGAKSFHLVAPGYGNLSNFPAAANPYAVRVTGNTPNASIVELAVSQSPTFFTLSEFGGNDVLGYATSGGDGSNPITPTATFDAALNATIGALMSTGAKGAIGNLPDITSLAFFTTVAYNPVPLDAATAGAINQGYAQYNGGLLVAQANNLIDADEVAARTINFSASAGNAVVIEDEYLTDLSGLGLPNYRQTTADDLILLTAAGLLPQGGGTASPLSDTFVLTPEEQADILTATQAYNASLAAVASANGLALVDLNATLEQASTLGFSDGDFTLTTDLVTGGLISLDGVHLTARGYAIMANEFLKAIDATYGSNFIAAEVKANPGDYPTNYSPLLQ